jgi:aspartokinase-like uncharacterized kinase
MAQTSAVIVPGGGPFADAVRDTQRTLHYSDQLAHGLAIQAMGLYGRLLLGLEPRLTGHESVESLRIAQADPSARVWLPAPDEPCLATLEASWNITSDSLSAQLALTLGIPRLLLVKAIEMPRGAIKHFSDLEREGLIDPCLHQICRNTGLEVWVTGPSLWEGLAEGLENPVSCFTRVETRDHPSD